MNILFNIEGPDQTADMDLSALNVDEQRSPWSDCEDIQAALFTCYSKDPS